MNTGLIVLLFVGIILMTANAATQKQKKEDTVTTKYLPRDLDTYFREDATQPSILYGSMFTENDIIR